MENQPFRWYLPGKMGIFMGYVSLPEGIRKKGEEKKETNKKNRHFKQNCKPEAYLIFLNSDKQHVLFSKSSEVKPLGLCLDPPLLYYYI